MQQICHLHPRNLAKLSRIGNQLSSSPFTHLLHSIASDSSHLSSVLQGRIPYSQLLQIHGRIFRLNLDQDDLIATRLVGHYPPKLVLRVFNLLQRPNIFPFNAVIRVLSEGGFSWDAFAVFQRLKFCSLLPNDLTFSFLLKACYGFSNVNCVKQIHTHIVKSVCSYDFFVCNGLLNVYAKKFGDLASARKVFDDMPDQRTVCCWSSMISGYASSSNTEEVLRLFSSMVMKNLRPENDTMVSVLSACSNLEIPAIEKWVQDLSELVNIDGSCKLCCDSVNIVLIYLLGRWGKVDKSRERFEDISDEGKLTSVVSWNAMISAYVQNGCALEGLALFRLMIRERRYANPNHITMVSALSACAQIGDLELGIWIHEYMKNTGHANLLTSNKNLATALIDMYSKCGCLDKAREIFYQMVTKDVVCFNAMIMGLAVNGEGKEALELFARMQELGLCPNANTFLSILCSCSHTGMLEEGRKLFRYMQQLSISPGLEHYACYIDLLARMGCIEEAMAVISSAPFEPNDFVLGALLGGCLLHNRLDLACSISNMLVNVNPHNSAGYVLLSNALAVDNHWGDVSGLRRFMRETGVSKQPGCSWVSIGGLVHEFIAGSASHPQYESIWHVLDGLQKEMKLVNSLEIM